jgi:broad specificity phosphatase PhoE
MEYANVSYKLARPINQPVLYIVRHGWTGDDNSYNSPINPNLDKKGWDDAKAAAEYFSNKNTGSIRTSGFKRAAATAGVIANRLGKTPVMDDRLDSWDVGDVANAPSSEEADRIIAHHVQHPNKVIPGGESLAQLQARATPVLMEGVQEGLRTGKPPIYIAHHSIQHEAGRLFNGDHESALTHTGGAVAVYKTPNGFKAIPVFRPEKD